MDPGAFYRKDQAAFFLGWENNEHSLVPEHRPCSATQVLHFSIEVKHEEVTDQNAIEWASRSFDSEIDASARILLAPARHTSKDEAGDYVDRNSDPLPPFKPKTFKLLGDMLKLHPGGCVRNEQCSQVSKLVTARNITSIYMENLSHREYWIRLFVIFDAETRTSTSLLLHLLPPERDFIEQKLRDKTLYPLTLHPLFVPTLVIELLFQETTEYLDFAFGASIGMYIAAGLHDSAGYRYYKRTDLDMEKAAEKSLGHGQRIPVLCEKLESNVKMANKLLSWFGELPTDKMSAEQKEHFESAGAIIRNRLESLIDGFGFQLIRLKRVQGHAQLNRVGLQVRNAILGNKLSARISEQRRDIAHESRRDSSAMKAIAVLTMFFLPGTFSAAFFAMPLFEWNSSASSSGATGHFWIYWAATIPATISVLVVWRLWYVFDEWRWSCEKKGSVYQDLWAWLSSSSSSKSGKTDLESGGELVKIFEN